jgi:hypothetical protein
MHVYKNIQRESNPVPHFRFVDDGIAGLVHPDFDGEQASAAATSLKREPGFMRWRQIAASFKHSELSKKYSQCCRGGL